MNEMVETKEAYENDWLDVEFLDALSMEERRGTIYDEGMLDEIEGQYGTFKRVKIGVEFINGKQKQWTVSKTSHEKLSNATGSTNTKDWLGVKVFFSIGKIGNRRVIEATPFGKKDGKDETLGEVIN